MEPRTQTHGALQPPGRVPPVATGTVTPPPPPAPGSAPPTARGSNIGRWVVSLSPMPVMFISSVVTVAASNEKIRVVGFLAYTVSLFLIGLFMGLGRYRGRESHEKIR